MGVYINTAKYTGEIQSNLNDVFFAVLIVLGKFRYCLFSRTKTYCMNKFRLSFAIMLFVFVIADSNSSYAFSVTRNNHPIYSLKYLKCKEFVKLSYKEFTALTREKRSLKNWVAFKMLKAQMKHDLKRNPQLTLTNYPEKPGHQVNVVVILAILLVLLLVAGVLALILQA